VYIRKRYVLVVKDSFRKIVISSFPYIRRRHL